MNVTRYSSAVSTFIKDLLDIYRDIWTQNNVNIGEAHLFGSIGPKGRKMYFVSN